MLTYFREKTDHIPDIRTTVKKRTKRHGGGAHTHRIVINLRGDDIETLKPLSRTFIENLKEDPQLIDLDVSLKEGRP